jgi:ankyrin repeat protein
MYAAWLNTNPEITETLLRSGADISARTDERFGLCDALMLAAKNNTCPEVLQLLIEAGADVNPPMKDLRSPESIRSYETPLTLALQYNRNSEVALLLLDCGADPNETNFSNYPPLYYAIECNYNRPSSTDIVQALIRAGADLQWVEDMGSPTILMLAINNYSACRMTDDYDIAIITSLLEAGAPLTLWPEPGALELMLKPPPLNSEVHELTTDEISRLLGGNGAIL